MNSILAFYESVVVYGSANGGAADTGATRGAGKRTYCLLEVAKTLAEGARVWIKLPLHAKPESVLKELGMIRIIVSEKTETQYEKTENNKKAGEIGQPFFGAYSFAETVGLWLKSGREPAAALLNPFISTEGFLFTPAEYIDLRERLQLAMRRYERLPEVSRGLEDLNTGFFRHRSLEESREFIESHLAEYLVRGDALHREYLLAIHRHARVEIISRRAEINRAGRELASLKEKLAAANKLSGRHRRKTIQQMVKDLNHYRKENGTDHERLPAEKLDAISDALAGQVNLLEESRKHLTREMQSAGLALSPLTVNPRHGKPETLKSLETGLRDLIGAVNEAGLYQLPIGGAEAATTPRQLQQLENLLDRLRNTRHHLTEFPLFYDRRQFWYAQPAHLRRLLAPLLDLPTGEWEHAFSSWYFERCLEREAEPYRYRTGVNTLRQRFSAWEADDLATGIPVATSTDRIHFLRAADRWPSQNRPEDLLLDLTGHSDPPLDVNCRYLGVSPLQDSSARHLAVAGRRNPALLFTQFFLPLTPPDWTTRRVEAAPAGTPTDQVLIRSTGSAWMQLTEWAGEKSAELHLYFPAKLSALETTYLADNWEELILSAPTIKFTHGWSPHDITQALLSDGFNVKFLCAALLRAGEASETEPYDPEALLAIGNEVRLRCGIPVPSPHPLAEEFSRLLNGRLPDHFIETHRPWRDTFLPLLVTAPDGKKTVLLPNGRLPGAADDLSEARRQGELARAGFGLVDLPADLLWENVDAVLADVINQLAAD